MTTKNKFVYSCSEKNLCFRIQRTLVKHFLTPAGCRSIFPAKHCGDAWRSSSRLARGQMNMWNEIKFWSPLLSAFEMVVWHAVRWCCGEELCPFCWPMAATGVAVFSVSHWLSDLLNVPHRYNDFAGIQKAVVDQMGSRPPNSDHDLFFSFGESLALGSLWSFFLVQPLS